MSNFALTKDYNDQLAKVQTTDLVHADTINLYFEQLLNNHNVARRRYVSEKVMKELVAHRLMASARNAGGLGSFIIIGDSITQGSGAPTYKDQYASLFAESFLQYQNGGGYGYEMICNMDSALQNGITYSGSVSYGTRGPVKKSLIMQPGAVITITGRTLAYLDFYFHRHPAAGKLEIRRAGVLAGTLDCSGVDTEDVLSFTLAGSTWTSFGRDMTATYTVTCTTAAVEITGILSQKTGKGVTQITRMAMSGTATSDYIDAPTLASIGKIGSYYNAPGIYLIALGTNDIYNAGKAITPAAYALNIKAMITGIRAVNVNALFILTVPPIANESVFPAILAPHIDYKNAIYTVAAEYRLPVVDYSEVDLLGLGWYIDGVHPNQQGHYAMARHLCEQVGIPFCIDVPKNVSDLVAASTSAVAPKFKRIIIPMTNFIDGTAGVKQLTVGLGINDAVVGVYFQFNCNILVRAFDYVDHANNFGLYYMRGISGGYSSTFYYNSAGGFCKVWGPLASYLSNDPAVTSLVIEYITNIGVVSNV